MPRPREFKEAAVLDRAVDVFWRQGFERTAVADVCDATGLHPGSVYAAFGDKEGLFIAALRRYAEKVSAAAIAVLDEPANGERAIRRYFEMLVDAMVGGRRRYGCLITNTLVERHATNEAIADLLAAHLARLETSFAHALVRSGAKPADALVRAAGLVCFVQGLNVIAKTRPGRKRLEALVSAALAGFVPSRRVKERGNARSCHLHRSH